MFSIEVKYDSLFGLINAIALVNSGFLLERETVMRNLIRIQLWNGKMTKNCFD